jgi:hypothetical protein
LTVTCLPDTTTRDGRSQKIAPTSYALMLLLTLPFPLSMWYFSIDEGDSTFYWRITGIVAMVIIRLMALTRGLAWYVFRFGGASSTPHSMAPASRPPRLGERLEAGADAGRGLLRRRVHSDRDHVLAGPPAHRRAAYGDRR